MLLFLLKCGIYNRLELENDRTSKETATLLITFLQKVIKNKKEIVSFEGIAESFASFVENSKKISKK